MDEHAEIIAALREVAGHITRYCLSQQHSATNIHIPPAQCFFLGSDGQEIKGNDLTLASEAVLHIPKALDLKVGHLMRDAGLPLNFANLERELYHEAHLKFDDSLTVAKLTALSRMLTKETHASEISRMLDANFVGISTPKRLLYLKEFIELGAIPRNARMKLTEAIEVMVSHSMSRDKPQEPMENDPLFNTLPEVKVEFDKQAVNYFGLDKLDFFYKVISHMKGLDEPYKHELQETVLEIIQDQSQARKI